jgi:trk system potassium uptake protein TrkA
VVRDGKVLTTRSDTEIKAHDRLILLAQSNAVRRVEQLFSVSVDYF